MQWDQSGFNGMCHAHRHMHVCKPVQKSLIDSPSEEHIQQKPLHHRQPDDPAGKPEPVQVVLQEDRGGADLDCVRVIGRVLKESVVRVEDLSGEKEEEFTRWTTIVKS